MAGRTYAGVVRGAGETTDWTIPPMALVPPVGPSGGPATIVRDRLSLRHSVFNRLGGSVALEVETEVAGQRNSNPLSVNVVASELSLARSVQPMDGLVDAHDSGGPVNQPTQSRLTEAVPISGTVVGGGAPGSQQVGSVGAEVSVEVTPSDAIRLPHVADEVPSQPLAAAREKEASTGGSGIEDLGALSLVVLPPNPLVQDVAGGDKVV